MVKFNLGTLKSESKNDKTVVMFTGELVKGCYFICENYELQQSAEHYKCIWILSKYFNLLMSITIIKALIELMKHTVMSL